MSIIDITNKLDTLIAKIDSENSSISSCYLKELSQIAQNLKDLEKDEEGYAWIIFAKPLVSGYYPHIKGYTNSKQTAINIANISNPINPNEKIFEYIIHKIPIYATFSHSNWEKYRGRWF